MSISNQSLFELAHSSPPASGAFASRSLGALSDVGAPVSAAAAFTHTIPREVRSAGTAIECCYNALVPIVDTDCWCWLAALTG